MLKDQLVEIEMLLNCIEKQKVIDIPGGLTDFQNSILFITKYNEPLETIYNTLLLLKKSQESVLKADTELRTSFIAIWERYELLLQKLLPSKEQIGAFCDFMDESIASLSITIKDDDLLEAVSIINIMKDAQQIAVSLGAESYLVENKWKGTRENVNRFARIVENEINSRYSILDKLLVTYSIHINNNRSTYAERLLAAIQPKWDECESLHNLLVSNSYPHIQNISRRHITTKGELTILKNRHDHMPPKRAVSSDAVMTASFLNSPRRLSRQKSSPDLPSSVNFNLS